MTALSRCTLVVLASLVLAGCERPPVVSVQRGYRGLGMEEVFNPRTAEATYAANQVPVSLPPAPPGGPPASSVFKNVQVLKDVDVAEFTRLMVSITQWVSPDQGCVYCHVADDYASDALYTKVVSRRMLEMTQHVNADWTPHVAATGVTCYTCHRGQPVPPNIWFENPGPPTAQGMAGNKAGQNAPAPEVGLASLPFDPFTPFLGAASDIRVVSTTALPADNHSSIKQTEWTYGLMMHMSQALGVNCTYCHNSRSFSAWESSTPQRASAWYGIRMVRDLNRDYLGPLAVQLPASRRGVLGDGPKLNCATCHNGVYKPLYGAATAKDFPELTRHPPVAAPVVSTPVAAAEATAKP